MSRPFIPNLRLDGAVFRTSGIIHAGESRQRCFSLSGAIAIARQNTTVCYCLPYAVPVYLDPGFKGLFNKFGEINLVLEQLLGVADFRPATGKTSDRQRLAGLSYDDLWPWELLKAIGRCAKRLALDALRHRELLSYHVAIADHSDPLLVLVLPSASSNFILYSVACERWPGNARHQRQPVSRLLVSYTHCPSKAAVGSTSGHQRRCHVDFPAGRWL